MRCVFYARESRGRTEASVLWTLPFARSPLSLPIPLPPSSCWRGPACSPIVPPCRGRSWLDSPTSAPRVSVVLCLWSTSLSQTALGYHSILGTGNPRDCEWGEQDVWSFGVRGSWRAGAALTVGPLSLLFQGGNICVPCGVVNPLCHCSRYLSSKKISGARGSSVVRLPELCLQPPVSLDANVPSMS